MALNLSTVGMIVSGLPRRDEYERFQEELGFPSPYRSAQTVRRGKARRSPVKRVDVPVGECLPLPRMKMALRCTIPLATRPPMVGPDSPGPASSPLRNDFGRDSPKFAMAFRRERQLPSVDKVTPSPMQYDVLSASFREARWKRSPVATLSKGERW